MTRWPRSSARCDNSRTRPERPSSSTTIRTEGGSSGAVRPSSPRPIWSGRSREPTATMTQGLSSRDAQGRRAPWTPHHPQGATGRGPALGTGSDRAPPTRSRRAGAHPRSPYGRQHLAKRGGDRSRHQPQAQDRPECARDDDEGDPATIRRPRHRGQERPAAIPYARPPIRPARHSEEGGNDSSRAVHYRDGRSGGTIFRTTKRLETTGIHGENTSESSCKLH